MKSVFVTGSSGFVGQHFATWAQNSSEWRVLAAPADFDLRDANGVMSAIAALPACDAVLHLAAQSNVPQSFSDPAATFDINFQGTLRLLLALRANDFHGRFIHVGTADAYGLVPESELPVREERALKPRNPYAVSKMAAEALVYQWTQSEGLNAVMVRPFNHIGPGQDERFAVAAFARQVAEIALGRREARIAVGDLGVSRDFTDVRDVVGAYGKLLTRGAPGSIYNIGSGHETCLSEILDRLIAVAGIEAEIIVETARLRPSEQRRMVADPSYAREAIDWQPRIQLEQTLKDIYSDWKERLKHG
jgi:GDP-4-dehydro-6-deoxy-D-mannose reductase